MLFLANFGQICPTSHWRNRYKMDVVIIQFIQHTIVLWRTKIVLHMADGTIETDEITITCGIFQGDSFSPLIFCIVLPFLSLLYPPLFILFLFYFSLYLSMTICLSLSFSVSIYLFFSVMFCLSLSAFLCISLPF